MVLGLCPKMLRVGDWQERWTDAETAPTEPMASSRLGTVGGEWNHREISMQRARSAYAVVVLIVTAATSCTGVVPSSETEALEQWLMTADEAGSDFVETYLGTAGFDEGKVCPASDYTIPSHGVARVEMTKGSDADRIELTEVLWNVEPAEMDALFAGLETAYIVCDGQQWTDYGDVKTFSNVTAPDLGEASLASRLLFGDGPEYSRQEFSVTIRQGELLAEFTVGHEGNSEATLSDAAFYTIISDALAKLPG